jgi:hypothetical protein
MEIVICVFLFFILILQIFILNFKNKRFLEEKSLKSVINFKDYITILNYHMDKAYALIYKDKIFIYSTEAIKLTDKQFAEISKEFANLTLKMIGPSLKKEFLSIYGTEETLLFSIVEYFNSRYEEDEIQKAAADKIMNKDIETDEKETLKSLF